MARKRIPPTEATVSNGAAAARATQTKTASGKRSTSEPAAPPATEVSEVTAHNAATQTADLNALHESIARLAYSYWEARGYQGGSAEEDWLRAEQEIRNSLAKTANV